MNKGITAEQVAKVMDLDADGTYVQERLHHPKLGHVYRVTFTQDLDFNMHDIIALSALFGATGVSATYDDEDSGMRRDFAIAVTET